MLEYKQNEFEVKSVKDRVIHGTGIAFGTPETKDSYGEFFTDKSEVGLQNGTNRPFLLEHGWSQEFGKAVLGYATFEKADLGWNYETVFIDSEIGNKAYNKIINAPYRSSAGAAGHTRQASLVKGAMHLDTWLVGEQSATLTPADSNNPRLTRTKSEADYMMFAMQEMQAATMSQVKEFLQTLFKDSNDARTKLADALTSLKESFSSGDQNSKFEITEEFLTSLEQVTQPIPIINLG